MPARCRPALRSLMNSELHGFLMGDHNGASAFEALLRQDRSPPASDEAASASQASDAATRTLYG